MGDDAKALRSDAGARAECDYRGLRGVEARLSCAYSSRTPKVNDSAQAARHMGCFRVAENG